MAVCLCTCVKTACFPTDEKPFFEAAADGPARKMTRLRLRARLRAPRRVEARAPDPPLPPGRGQVGQTAKVSGEGEADEQGGKRRSKRRRRKPIHALWACCLVQPGGGLIYARGAPEPSWESSDEDACGPTPPLH
ncbi:unnamed protein product [Prorocentrum cordatum]|uniref:Uncharacterized protein n=2 Tax=Prorocentrum cordatum TaxID=2364126 RepID=A0ABN9S8R0_9DINO|nr:unnamed protein product [Polarella glacialis]